MAFGNATRRHFTDAARLAAAEARRRKREMHAAGFLDHQDVFVVRQPDVHVQYGWEIRRFGGVVVQRSDAAYACIREARSAGELTLSNLRGGLRRCRPPNV